MTITPTARTTKPVGSNWALVGKYADLLRFVKLLIARRLLRDMEAELQRLGLDQLLREGKLTWHGVRVGQPDWSNYSHSLAHWR